MEQKNWLLLNNEVKLRDSEGNFQYHKDKEAVKSYFIDHVNQNMRFFHDLEEKIDYLTTNNYWDKEVLDKYKFRQIKELNKLVYGQKFRFKSFMSAFKFYNNYALKTNDKKRYLERYEDRIIANALFLGNGDYANKTINLLHQHS